MGADQHLIAAVKEGSDRFDLAAVGAGRVAQPQMIVTDRLRSYSAAIKVIGNAKRQNTGRWLNNRAENSHLPFRRRVRAMLRFRSLQKFASVHASVQNHFKQELHLYSRSNLKLNRTAALDEWRELGAA